jgi:hypothetical protein
MLNFIKMIFRSFLIETSQKIKFLKILKFVYDTKYFLENNFEKITSHEILNIITQSSVLYPQIQNKSSSQHKKYSPKNALSLSRTFTCLSVFFTLISRLGVIEHHRVYESVGKREEKLKKKRRARKIRFSFMTRE